MKKTTAFLWVVLGLVAFGQGVAASVKYVQMPTSDEERHQQLLKDITVAMPMLSGKTKANYIQLEGLSRQIEALANIAERENHGEATGRTQIVRNLLGDDMYRTFEQSCLTGLEIGDEDLRVVARRILAQTLASHACEAQWDRQLRLELNALLKGENSSLSYAELFSLSESLAYLGMPTGMPILQDVLEDEDQPAAWKISAMKIMAKNNVSMPEIVLEKLLLSKEPVVAYSAFDCYQESWGQVFVLQAAKTQLNRIVDSHELHGTLTGQERTLLLSVGSALIVGHRLGKLSDDDKAFAKAKARHLLETGEVLIKERAIFLFAEFCGEEDEDLLQELMQSSSSILRSKAVYGLSHCPVEMLEKYREKLTELQNDADWQIRLFASNGLQKLANAEKARQSPASP